MDVFCVLSGALQWLRRTAEYRDLLVGKIDNRERVSSGVFKVGITRDRGDRLNIGKLCGQENCDGIIVARIAVDDYLGTGVHSGIRTVNAGGGDRANLESLRVNRFTAGFTVTVIAVTEFLPGAFDLLTL